MSKDEAETEGPGFVIKDRRHSQMSDEDAQKEEKSASSASSGAEVHPDLENFQIDFSTFVLSLTSSAFYHLGDLQDPETGKQDINLPAVKQTIDILLMLKEKTLNNLDDNEKKLLEQLIYELQVKYMSHKKK